MDSAGDQSAQSRMKFRLVVQNVAEQNNIIKCLGTAGSSLALSVEGKKSGLANGRLEAN
jgi:hypothetical protein